MTETQYRPLHRPGAGVRPPLGEENVPAEGRGPDVGVLLAAFTFLEISDSASLILLLQDFWSDLFFSTRETEAEADQTKPQDQQQHIYLPGPG